MAKLILSLNDKVLGEFPVNKECITLGRKKDNDIQVDNLSVSGHHAQLITILNDSFLEDLNSTNGTYVNSKLIKKHALQDNDIITLGKHQLRYVNELANKMPEDDFERTMIIRPDAEGMPSKDSQEALSKESMDKLNAELAAHKEKAKPNDSFSAKLQVLNGANAGKELNLTKALTTLGKPGFQVAAITRRPQGFFLIHVEGGSENTYPQVNGDSVGAQAHQLNDHDIIEIAGVKMEFFLAN